MIAAEVVEDSWVLREEPADLPAVVAAATAAGALDLRAVDLELPGFTRLTAHESVLALEQELPTLADTQALGARLAGRLRAGDLLVLSGPLGAGKTALTQGLGRALGVRGQVTSPTFVLVRVHPGPLPLVHVDAYRMLEQGAGALDDLDLDLALEDSVVVVEWGDGLAERLAGSWLEIRLQRPALDDGPPESAASSRLVQVWPRGPRWAVVQLHR